jgi:hypothetical protein
MKSSHAINALLERHKLAKRKARAVADGRLAHAFHGSGFSMEVGIPFSAFLYPSHRPLSSYLAFFASPDAFALCPLPFALCPLPFSHSRLGMSRHHWNATAMTATTTRICNSPEAPRLQIVVPAANRLPRPLILRVLRAI